MVMDENEFEKIDNDEYVSLTIKKDTYDELLKNEIFLQTLELFGLDNWERYDDALEEYNKIIHELEEKHQK